MHELTVSMSVSARVRANVKTNVNCKVYMCEIKFVKTNQCFMQLDSLKEDSEFRDKWSVEPDRKSNGRFS